MTEQMRVETMEGAIKATRGSLHTILATVRQSLEGHYDPLDALGGVRTIAESVDTYLAAVQAYTYIAAVQAYCDSHGGGKNGEKV